MGEKVTSQEALDVLERLFCVNCGILKEGLVAYEISSGIMDFDVFYNSGERGVKFRIHVFMRGECVYSVKLDKDYNIMD